MAAWFPTRRFLSSRALRGGETVVAAEYTVRRPDGTEIPVLGSAGPIVDGDGRLLGAVGVFQDVSERIGLERTVRENERLLKAVFDMLPVGVWIADRTGRIARNNPAGESVWRGARYVPVEEFGQYKGWWLDSGKPIAAEEWALARALTKGETSTGELVRIQCFDGTLKTIINSAAPLRDEGATSRAPSWSTRTSPRFTRPRKSSAPASGCCALSSSCCPWGCGSPTVKARSSWAIPPEIASGRAFAMSAPTNTANTRGGGWTRGCRSPRTSGE